MTVTMTNTIQAKTLASGCVVWPARGNSSMIRQELKVLLRPAPEADKSPGIPPALGRQLPMAG